MTVESRADALAIDFSGQTFDDYRQAQIWLRERLTKEFKRLEEEIYDECALIADISMEPCGGLIADKLRRRKEQMRGAAYGHL